ncbi:hypothetical protein GCM10022220_29660 [Actinocatenispora rupis]|uniref:Uncharacterized protein n=1 Tax=Actinocatenispora rupis TaxID=519421 RepID=A0A8J3JAM4_9ACTN|nr:hypothetical protein Aru02nite_40260 [Actinocatenispora rupis]
MGQLNNWTSTKINFRSGDHGGANVGPGGRETRLGNGTKPRPETGARGGPGRARNARKYDAEGAKIPGAKRAKTLGAEGDPPDRRVSAITLSYGAGGR